MTDAYVMLNCELGAEVEIIEKLKELDNVSLMSLKLLELMICW